MKWMLGALVLLSGCLAPGAVVESDAGGADDSTDWFDALPGSAILVDGSAILLDARLENLDGNVQAYAIVFLENQSVETAGYISASDQSSYATPDAWCALVVRAVPAPLEAFGLSGSRVDPSSAAWDRTLMLGPAFATDTRVYAEGNLVYEAEGTTLPGPGQIRTGAGSTEYGQATPVERGMGALMLLGVDNAAALKADSESSTLIKVRSDGSFKIKPIWQRPLECGSTYDNSQTSVELAAAKFQQQSSFGRETSHDASLVVISQGGTGSGISRIGEDEFSMEWQSGSFIVRESRVGAANVSVEVDESVGPGLMWMVGDYYDWHPSSWFPG